MSVSVKLSEIIDAVESQSDEGSAYLNRMTGEIVIFMEEELNAAEDDEPIDDYPEWQQEAIEKAREFLDNEEDYLGLPSKYDVHEYEIMEKFCLSIKDSEKSNALYNSIKGSGAFRRFREGIGRFELEDEWYRYRDESIKQIAIDWCEENNITYSG